MVYEMYTNLNSFPKHSFIDFCLNLGATWHQKWCRGVVSNFLGEPESLKMSVDGSNIVQEVAFNVKNLAKVSRKASESLEKKHLNA